MVSGGNKNFEFTVIAGSLKGRKIIAPDLGITRPPLTRLRKAIFDFLMPYLPRAHYLDLFSGSGSYLFEAVSRGALKAVGVELEKRLVRAINTQADKYLIAERLRCLEGDVLAVVPQLTEQGKKFDVIMVAPPQYVGLVDRTLVCLNENMRILAENSLIICQHDTSETKKIDFSGFSVNQHRKYGNTTFTILKS